jgi:hypothetical protein
LSSLGVLAPWQVANPPTTFSQSLISEVTPPNPFSVGSPVLQSLFLGSPSSLPQQSVFQVLFLVVDRANPPWFCPF